MSPEQARGQELDGRTDIWSFGCLLYEVLTSRRAFTGATVSDLTAAILKEEPDWTGIPADTPMSVRQLLQRCLQKDARRRLQAIGDARIELEDALRQIDNVADGTVPSGIDPLSGSMVGASSGFNVSAPGSPTVAAPAPSRGFGLAAVAVAVLSGAIAGAATGWLLRSPADTEGAPLTRLAVPVNGMRVDNVAISPDGRDLSLEARGDDGIWRLYRRQMETGALQPIAGSDEVYMPQFGANGAWLVGINDASALVRLAIGGSAPTVLTTDTAASTTYALLDDDRLLFGDSRRGLSLVPAGGGPSRSLIEPDLERGETALLFPVALPGSTHALYTAMVSAQGGVPNRLMAVDLASGASEIVMENARRAHYLPSGHLVFDRGESLWAVEFDPSTRRTLGDPVQLVDGVFYGQGRSVWAISDNGTLVFQEGEATASSMELVRAGADEDVDEGAVILSGETFEWPMLSADGNHLVAAIHGADQHGVWSYDVARGTRLRLSFVGNDGHPLWSPDGKTVVFYSGTSNGGNLYAVAADGSDGEAATQLTDSPLGLIPRSFSPDGRYLIFTQVTENAGGDILALDMESGEEEPILNSSFDENWGMVSPSGDWLAYTSDESGSVEVYLRPFGRNGPKIPVSSGGGDVPTWSVDGRTLYYRQGSTVMAASFSGGDEPDLGATRVIRDDVGAYYYPVPGSDAMILSRSSGAAADLPDHLVVIPNAIDEIRRRLGTQ
jgi:serine/threonine-protein kinase